MNNEKEEGSDNDLPDRHYLVLGEEKCYSELDEDVFNGYRAVVVRTKLKETAEKIGKEEMERDIDEHNKKYKTSQVFLDEIKKVVEVKLIEAP